MAGCADGGHQVCSLRAAQDQQLQAGLAAAGRSELLLEAAQQDVLQALQDLRDQRRHLQEAQGQLQVCGYKLDMWK